ncbi:MAG TPA: hypothetical protein VMU24_02420 [Candidatus Acidoferrales bacterium]|nr:hypothetical protein [Candidatus Acidoferrales bacterium]
MRRIGTIIATLIVLALGAGAQTFQCSAGVTHCVQVTCSDADTSVMFNIYRSSSASGPWTLLTATPISSCTYVDNSVVTVGTTYYYTATAVASGVESGKAQPASAVIPPSIPTGVGIVAR